MHSFSKIGKTAAWPEKRSFKKSLYRFGDVLQRDKVRKEAKIR
jgi:hypothetical protein